MVVSRFFVFILCCSVPAVAQEFLLSDPNFGSLQNVAFRAGVLATNGSGAVAVWQDATGRVFSSALDARGVMRQPSAVPIAPSGVPAALLWDGSRYVLALDESRIPLPPWRTRVITLDADGNRLAEEIVIDGLRQPSMAWNGRHLVVAGTRFLGSSGFATHAFVLDGALAVLREVPLTAGLSFTTAEVIASGEDFFLLTAAGPSVQAKWLSANGQLGEEIPIGRMAERSVTAAADGALVVGFVDSAEGPKVRSFLVSRSGEVIARDFPTAEPLGFFNTVKVARTATGFVVVQGSRQSSTGHMRVWALRLNDDGAPAGDLRFLIQLPHFADLGNVAVLTTGPAAIVRDGGVLGSRHAVIRFDIPSGAIGREVVSRLAVQQSLAAVAGDLDQFLAVWVDVTSETQAIRATRVNRAGESLDRPSITVVEIPGLFAQPAVEFGRTDYLVVWQMGQVLVGRRVTRDGVVLDPQLIFIRSLERVEYVGVPSITWNGEHFLVTWTEGGRIWGAPVTSNGVVQPARPLTPVPAQEPRFTDSHHSPQVVWTGAEFVVTFSVRRMYFCVGIPCPTEEMLGAVRISRSGGPVDLEVLVFGRGTFLLRAATSGSDVLVAYGGPDTFGVILGITPNGLFVRTGPFHIQKNAMPARVLWTGESFVVVMPRHLGAGQVSVANVALDGAVAVRETGYLAANDAARASSGEILVVGSRRISDPPYYGMARAVAWYVPPPTRRTRAVAR